MSKVKTKGIVLVGITSMIFIFLYFVLFGLPILLVSDDT